MEDDDEMKNAPHTFEKFMSSEKPYPQGKRKAHVGMDDAKRGRAPSQERRAAKGVGQIPTSMLWVLGAVGAVLLWPSMPSLKDTGLGNLGAPGVLVVILILYLALKAIGDAKEQAIEDIRQERKEAISDIRDENREATQAITDMTKRALEGMTEMTRAMTKEICNTQRAIKEMRLPIREREEGAFGELAENAAGIVDHSIKLVGNIFSKRFWGMD